MDVFYLGPEGSYSHQTAHYMFGGNYNLVSCKSFDEIFTFVDNVKESIGIIPIKNSITGDINPNAEIVIKGDYHIIKIYDLPINHYLVSLKAQKLELSSIKKLLVHPQTQKQCSIFIDSLKDVEIINVSSNSEAARLLLESKDTGIVAISNKESVSIYNLDILKENISNKAENVTTFIAIQK